MTAKTLRFEVSELMAASGGVFTISLGGQHPTSELKQAVVAAWTDAWMRAGRSPPPPLLILAHAMELAAMGAAEVRARGALPVASKRRRPKVLPTPAATA